MIYLRCVSIVFNPMVSVCAPKHFPACGYIHIRAASGNFLHIECKYLKRPLQNPRRPKALHGQFIMVLQHHCLKPICFKMFLNPHDRTPHGQPPRPSPSSPRQLLEAPRQPPAASAATSGNPRQPPVPGSTRQPPAIPGSPQQHPTAPSSSQPTVPLQIPGMSEFIGQRSAKT